MRKSLVVAAALAALVIPAVAVGAAGDFGQPPTSPETVGASPTSVVAGVMNGDSNLDLAVANGGPDNVSILLGDGAGDFTPAGTSPEGVGTDPSALTLANLNGDSNIDLAVANTGTDNVSILLGDGSGNFTAAAFSPETVGDQPNSITAADLDGDADTDLAVPSFVPAEVAILLNNGSGDFTPAATSPESVGGVATNTAGIVAGNFNGAGGNDLAVASEFSNDVKILLNSGLGDGNFTAAGTSPEAALDPRGLTTANLNGDANLDLAAPNAGTDNVTILLGDGTGNFTAAGTSPEGAGDFPNAVAAVDLNGDNIRDLAVTNATSGNVSILLGDNTGNFTAASGSPEGAGTFPSSIATAPLDADNNRDLAVTNLTSGNVTILLNDATSTPPPSGNPPASPPAQTPAAPKKKCKKSKKSAAGAKKGKCGKKKK